MTDELDVADARVIARGLRSGKRRDGREQREKKYPPHHQKI